MDIEILQMDTTTDTYLVIYTDDIAAVKVAWNTDDAQMSLNQVMRRVSSWRDEFGLDLPTEKKSYCFARLRSPRLLR